MGRKRDSDDQLELPWGSTPAATPPAPRATAPAPAPGVKAQVSANIRQGLRVIQGGGQRVQEPLASRDAVVRVLVETGADLLLRRISSARAEEIEKRVDRVLDLFDKVDRSPVLMSVLQRELDDLEALMGETRSLRQAQRGR